MRHPVVENHQTSKTIEWRQTRRRDRYDSTCWRGGTEIGRVRMALVGSRTGWHWSMTVDRSDLVACSKGTAPTRDAACRMVLDTYRRTMF